MSAREADRGFRLTAAQEQAVSEMLARLKSHIEGLRRRRPHERAPAKGAAQDEEAANVFAFGGPRGAGKSTLLRALQQNLDTQGIEGAAVAVVDVLDCSTVAGGYGPSVAALAQVLECTRLWERVREGHRRDRQKDLRAVASLAARSESSFESLAMELSTSLDEFPEYMLRGAMDRLRLRQSLSNVLDAICRDANVACLVIPLDDFDLVESMQVRAWRQSLLDELLQPRFVFVTTADFERLDRFADDTPRIFDPPTERALFQKVLPVSHRVRLRSWTVEERWTQVKSAIARFTKSVPWMSGVVRQLLPQWPRGLFDLPEALAHTEPVSSVDSGSLEVKKPALTVLPGFLAETRQEPLLARRIREVPVGQWVREFAWPDSVGVSVWTRSVEAARDYVLAASEDGARMLPIEALKPRSLLDAPREFEPEQQDAERLSPTRQFSDWRETFRDRHRAVWDDVLRDVHPADRTWWAELLVDRELHASYEAKLLLFERWHVLAKRLRRAAFRVEVDGALVREFLTARAFEAHSLLPWVRCRDSSEEEGRASPVPGEPAHTDDRDTFTLDIGFEPLVGVLGGRRSWWPDGMIRRLGLSPASVRGEQYKLLPAEDMGVVPSHVRSLVLLVDALDACRWELWSQQAWRWQVSTFARLAVALVRTAYLHALRARGLLVATLPQTQGRFLDLLGGNQGLLTPREDETNHALDKLFSESERAEACLAATTSLDPLLTAARAFFAHPVYTRFTRPAED